MPTPASKKIAIFTEGRTEQIFAEALLRQIAGDKKISIEARKAIGGRRFDRFAYVLKSADHAEPDFYALLWNSGSDSAVASDVRDQYASLVAAGYSVILAIRDVFPLPSTGIEKIKAAFLKYVTQAPVAPVLVLATREIEAWFIGEHTHFPRVAAALTTGEVQNRINIDLPNQDVEQIPHPTFQLNQVYELAGQTYDKSEAHVNRTVSALDLDAMIQAARAPSMTPLLTELRAFLA